MVNDPMGLPSVDEVLGGDSQGGVPRPSVSTDHLFPDPVIVTKLSSSSLLHRAWHWLRRLFGGGR